MSNTRKRLRWILFIVAGVILVFMMREVLNPFGDKGYTGISHGDHTHYVPEDRDPNVPISNFPHSPPGPGERITPTGQIVPIE